MTCIYKIILAMVVAQVALVLSKPRKHEYDDGQYHYNENSEYFVYKRAGKTHLYICKLFFFPNKIKQSQLTLSGTKNDLGIGRANYIVCLRDPD